MENELSLIPTIVAFTFQLLAIITPHWEHTFTDSVLTEYSGLWEVCSVKYNHLNMSSANCDVLHLDIKIPDTGILFHTRIVAILTTIVMASTLILRTLLVCCMKYTKWSHSLACLTTWTSVLAGTMAMITTILYAVWMRNKNEESLDDEYEKSWSFGLEIAVSLLCILSVVVTALSSRKSTTVNGYQVIGDSTYSL